MSTFTYIRAVKLAQTEATDTLLQAAAFAALGEPALANKNNLTMHERLDNALLEVQERMENHGHSKTFDEPVPGSKVLYYSGPEVKDG